VLDRLLGEVVGNRRLGRADLRGVVEPLARGVELLILQQKSVEAEPAEPGQVVLVLVRVPVAG